MSTRKHPSRSILFITESYSPLINAIKTNVNQITLEFLLHGHRVAIAAIPATQHSSVRLCLLTPCGQGDWLALSQHFGRVFPFPTGDVYYHLQCMGCKNDHAHTRTCLEMVREGFGVVRLLGLLDVLYTWCMISLRDTPAVVEAAAKVWEKAPGTQLLLTGAECAEKVAPLVATRAASFSWKAALVMGTTGASWHIKNSEFNLLCRFKYSQNKVI